MHHTGFGKRTFYNKLRVYNTSNRGFGTRRPSHMATVAEKKMISIQAKAISTANFKGK